MCDRMGTLEPEAKQSETNDGLKKNPAVNSGKEKESGHDNSRLSPGQNDKNTQLASEENGDGNPVINRSSMDRPDDSDADYRIPSSVFARNKSSAPMEWSVASTESLFSIHMETMSFTRDQSWLGKSGELGLAGDISSVSAPVSPMINRSIKQHQNNLSPINISAKHNADVKVSDSKAAETMREVIKENEDAITKKSHRSASFRRSDVSGASVKSFAFPILTDKGDSSKPHTATHSPSLTHTPKVSQEPAESQNKPQAENTNPEIPPKPPSNSGQSKWFACLPCCSSRS